MIWFDVTKAGAQRHRSGLQRVSACLLRELGGAARPFSWQEGAPPAATAADWLITTELFDATPGAGGWADALVRRPGPARLAAVFHDAIPLRHPTITWPHSVARHPAYVKALARFDRVWAVSAASRDELLALWRWQRIERPPPVDVLALGADAAGEPRVSWAQRSAVTAAIPRGDTAGDPTADRPLLLCVGILEPRKNQAFLLEVAEALWQRGQSFALHLVGRVNPHFGAPIVARVRALRRAGRPLWHHGAADDATVAALHERARATLFPTLAEGCGLPLLESLWRGVPCVCSDLPVLRENAEAGGCLPVPLNDTAAWIAALTAVLTEPARVERLIREATMRPLPTWAETARQLREGCAVPR